jgi:hypothetical protein
MRTELRRKRPQTRSGGRLPARLDGGHFELTNLAPEHDCPTRKAISTRRKDIDDPGEGKAVMELESNHLEACGRKNSEPGRTLAPGNPLAHTE